MRLGRAGRRERESEREESKNWYAAAVQKRGPGSSGDAYRH